ARARGALVSWTRAWVLLLRLGSLEGAYARPTSLPEFPPAPGRHPLEAAPVRLQDRGRLAAHRRSALRRGAAGPGACRRHPARARLHLSDRPQLLHPVVPARCWSRGVLQPSTERRSKMADKKKVVINLATGLED